jgi:membrane protease YdiL (CAAX protease family)
MILRPAMSRVRVTRDTLPFYTFALLFAAADIIKATVDPGGAELALLEAVCFGLLCWLTTIITPTSQPETGKGRLIGLQFVAIAVIILVTAYNGMILNNAPSVLIPEYNRVYLRMLSSLQHRLPMDIAVGVLDTCYATIPTILILILLKVTVRKLGLGSFRRGALAAAGLWLIAPAVTFVVLILTGRLRILFLIRVLLSNLLQAGFCEEFLYRGALLNRLRAVLSGGWALVMQALVFGAWHYGLNVTAYHGNILDAAAEMIVNQALFGYAMGFLAMRAGNIAVPVAFHSMWDALSDFGVNI